MTGAAGFVIFAGVVVGPSSFALIATLTGSDRAGFAAFAALSVAVALALLRSPERSPERIQ